MKVTALLTGKGNNTLQGKNVMQVCNHPVLYYPANAAKKSKNISAWYCSSDGEDILSLSSDMGYQPIKRPDELAQPNSQHIDCILHALDFMKAQNDLPDILVVLLANNVTVKSKWIDDCIEIMQNDSTLTAVVPTFEKSEFHPLRAKSVNADGTLEMYEKGITQRVSTNRQDLPSCVFLAHNFWVLNVQNVLSGKVGQPPWDFMGDKIMSYPVCEGLDIHDEDDVLLASRWIENNYED